MRRYERHAIRISGGMASPDPRRRRGRFAEELATWWLRSRGWSVPLRNSRVAGVEIDLLARRGRTEALVEVKARLLRPDELPPPAHELLSASQRRRLGRAAECRAQEQVESLRVRIDLVVVLFGQGLPRLQHLEDLEARSEFQP